MPTEPQDQVQTADVIAALEAAERDIHHYTSATGSRTFEPGPDTVQFLERRTAVINAAAFILAVRARGQSAYARATGVSRQAVHRRLRDANDTVRASEHLTHYRIPTPSDDATEEPDRAARR